jgi:hypothetical protein
MIGDAIGNHLLRLRQQCAFFILFALFFTSFDVAIEQRTEVDTSPCAPPYPRKAFSSKAPTGIANNCASSNTLLRKSEGQRADHVLTLCLSGNKRA